MADIVRCAPEALVKQNTFYLQLKLLMGQQNQEMVALKEVNISQMRDFNDLKARYKTLEKVHQ